MMMVAWLASSASYYALALNTGVMNCQTALLVAMFVLVLGLDFEGHAYVAIPGSLPGSFYGNAIVNFLVDVPALILAIPVYDHFGRKIAVCTGFFGGCLGMLGMILGNVKDIDSLLRTCAFLGKFFMQLAFGTVFVYTPELFPTALRSVGMGTCSWSARVGGITAPFVLRGHQLPGLFTLTSVTFAAGLGVLVYVPETLNKPMPT